MGIMLSEDQCMRIKQQKKKFISYAEKGWMCEGSDAFGPCNMIFNNETNEVFWADYNGNILDSDCLDDTPVEELRIMARIQGKMRKIEQEVMI